VGCFRGTFCVHTLVRLKNFQMKKWDGLVTTATRCGSAAALMAMALGLGGCSRFRPKPKENYVYVTAKQTFLRDRVAAVSNRTGTATNGEKLIVLDHARRFLKVQTPDGSIGWIEEKLTAGQEVADRFEALGAEHEKDPVVASATARDEVYLHIAPGKETERFYRLAEGDTLSLLRRAAVEKPVTPGAAVAAVASKPGEVTAPVGPVYEDWWLVRDAKGRTGWIYSHMIDVSAPDALARYAEGQRYVGAYLLGYADDPDSGMLNNGNPVTRIPEYVTVLSPYKAGLPYDFNQVRVFTWNPKKHRYETAMRDHNIAGYLPVVIADKADPYSKAANAAEKLPSFTYRVLAGDQEIPVPDGTTGLIKPGRTLTKTYRLEGNICRRLIAPGTQAPAEAHPDPEPVKKVKAGKRK
jgi:SH3-like domain-containing protein